MVVTENESFSRDYLDPEKRAIGNALTVRFKDGTRTERVAVDYPIGHRRRRAEGVPKLLEKFTSNLATRFGGAQCARIEAACAEQAALESLAVHEFMDLWVA
jgi:2-methylcitrate dehydratase